MMKTVFLFSTLLIFYFMYGFYISQSDYLVVPEMIRKNTSTLYYDYKGIINTHSQLSIGSGNAQTIVAAAKDANLDFLILTDLNVFNSPIQDSYYGELLFLNGGKYSYLDSRIIYYSPQNQSLGMSLGDNQVQMTDLLTKQPKEKPDSLVLLAHPFKVGFDWTGNLPTGLDGFELLNVKSLAFRAWQDSKISVFWTLLVYPFNARLAFIRLFSEPTEELRLFDEVNQSRKMIGTAGAEASARAIPWSNYLMRFPSYQRSFDIFTNHILLQSELTGHLANDRQKVFQAIKNGNLYLSFDLIGNPQGFYAMMEDKNKKYLMGSELKLSPDLKIKIHLPQQPNYFYEVVLYKNGAREETFNATDVEWKISSPGVYRVQVRVSVYLPIPDAKKWITWIYTNPFIVK